ncbi:hypothetical protein [Nocardioides alcanivorans]|nr:hypothetical protein [Nocardioides alcanivorans]
MNSIIFGLVGAGLASVTVVGGVQAYQAATIDKGSVPTIVNGANVTYADD